MFGDNRLIVVVKTVKLKKTQPAAREVLTMEEISKIVGITKPSVSRKKGLDGFHAGYRHNPSYEGRRYKMYFKEVLSLWGINPEYYKEKLEG